MYQKGKRKMTILFNEETVTAYGPFILLGISELMPIVNHFTIQHPHANSIIQCIGFLLYSILHVMFNTDTLNQFQRNYDEIVTRPSVIRLPVSTSTATTSNLLKTATTYQSLDR